MEDTAARAKISELERQMASNLMQTATLKNECDTQRARMKELSLNTAALNNERENHRKTIEQLFQNIAALRSDCGKHQRLIEQLLQDTATLKNERSKHEEMIGGLSVDTAALKAECSNSQRKIGELSVDTMGLGNERAKHEARIRDLSVDTVALKTKCSNNEERILELSAEIGSLRTDLSGMKSQQKPSPAPVQPPQRPEATLLDSLIVREFPAKVLSEFEKKGFTLLWRGTRDGFSVNTFHGRCDRHLNTLTIIEDVGGYIFGGFTPISWDSSDSYKADRSLRSFLFTLRNPAGTAPMKFSLIQPEHAIRCHPSYGPSFGYGGDIHVANQSDANMNSYTSLGTSYANYTGRASNVVFTGAFNFRAKEIEVFEIVA
jgi:predicted  nucleic acid-binding Zn-ribbon protein